MVQTRWLRLSLSQCSWPELNPGWWTETFISRIWSDSCVNSSYPRLWGLSHQNSCRTGWFISYSSNLKLSLCAQNQFSQVWGRHNLRFINIACKNQWLVGSRKSKPCPVSVYWPWAICFSSTGFLFFKNRKTINSGYSNNAQQNLRRGCSF